MTNSKAIPTEVTQEDFTFAMQLLGWTHRADLTLLSQKADDDGAHALAERLARHRTLGIAQGMEKAAKVVEDHEVQEGWGCCETIAAAIRKQGEA